MKKPELAWAEVVFSKPVIITTAVFGIFSVGLVANTYASPFFMLVAFTVGVIGAIAVQAAKANGAPAWHRILEGRALIFTVFATLAVLVGGIAELVPALIVKPAEAVVKGEVHPYSALEIEGRDIYIREGCYTCHSQQIRTMRFEAQRYGEASTLADSAFDHPFQWGSKRTGPDLAREGGRYPNLWHYRHMMDPRAITVGSNMPPYAHLKDDKVDLTLTHRKLSALHTVGVPYTEATIDGAQADATSQAQVIVKDLATEGVKVELDSQVVALISYLQRLGKMGDVRKPAPAVAAVTETNGGVK